MRSRTLRLVLVVLFLACVSAVIYYLFFLRMVKVPTGAMANTIISGDHLLINRRLGQFKRGEVVLFRYPKDPSVQYISRVIGLPGETVQVRHRSVFINGKELPEQRVMVRSEHDFEADVLEEISSDGIGPYRVFYASGREESGVPAEDEPGLFGTNAPFQIPQSNYYVMGDNRDNSEDSRFWGTVPRELMWGTASVIYWSAQKDSLHEENVRWQRMLIKVK